MARVTSWRVREVGGPVRPGDAANLLVWIDYVAPPIEAYFEVEGFGQKIRYGPVRDLQNPLVVEIPFHIPLGSSFPHVTITGFDITEKYTVVGGPHVTVTMYVRQNGKWVKVGSKRVRVNVVGAKPLSQVQAPQTTEKKTNWLLLGLGAAALYTVFKS